jgi:hypothetical protein
MSDVSWFKAILAGIIPGGQLYARAVWLDGSLDKLWLLIPIFLFPPFGLVFSIMIKMGKIAKGQGGKPYDWFMLIPIIAKILIALYFSNFLSYFIEEPSDNTILIYSVIVQVIVNMIPFLIRMITKCPSFSFNMIGKSFVDSIFTNFGGIILPIMLAYVPYLGKILEGLSFIPGVGEKINITIWSIGYLFTYLIINMINGDNITKYCDSGFFGKNGFETILFLITIVLTIIINIYKS